jgi:hypothetical protein
MVTFVTPETVTPFEWASQHIHLIGWPVLVTLAWKARGAVENFLHQSKTIAAQTETNLKISQGLQTELQTIGSNHLSHIEKDISELNQKYDRSTELLQSIDKGIGILVDRN